MRFYVRPRDAWYRWFAWRPIFIDQFHCLVWLEWVARRPTGWSGYEYRFLLADSYDDEARTKYRWRWSRTWWPR